MRSEDAVRPTPKEVDVFVGDDMKNGGRRICRKNWEVISLGAEIFKAGKFVRMGRK